MNWEMKWLALGFEANKFKNISSSAGLNPTKNFALD